MLLSEGRKMCDYADHVAVRKRGRGEGMWREEKGREQNKVRERGMDME